MGEPGARKGAGSKVTAGRGGKRTVWSLHGVLSLHNTHERQSPGTCWPTRTGDAVTKTETDPDRLFLNTSLTEGVISTSYMSL